MRKMAGQLHCKLSVEHAVILKARLAAVDAQLQLTTYCGLLRVAAANRLKCTGKRGFPVGTCRPAWASA